MQALQKIFPKGMLMMLVASLPLGFFRAEVAIPMFLLAMVSLVRWLFKPENIVAGSE